MNSKHTTEKTRSNKLFTLLTVIAISCSSFLMGCEEKGTMEKAGETMDEAAEEVKDEIDDHT